MRIQRTMGRAILEWEALPKLWEYMLRRLMREDSADVGIRDVQAVPRDKMMMEIRGRLHTGTVASVEMGLTILR
jgi:hypothetical protein